MFIDGTDITVPKADIQAVRKNIGMVFQPVSYTHLDVYKRQIRDREHVKVAPAEEAGDRPDQIILETSHILIATGSVPACPPIPGASLPFRPRSGAS